MIDNDTLDMHSSDLIDQNINKIADLFPNCITESKDSEGKLQSFVDFDLLRQELSRKLVEGGQERYRLDWPGKRQAILEANSPIAKTLRPAREESVNFDSTENLFIEGDNLDALKLLQESYLGEVKTIYIDPPYNTGNDFIYEDDFAEDTNDFLERSEQLDREGNRLVTNTDSNGRFHSDWLTMMYSRLKLARSLLTDDGIIVISIDENEVNNLKKLLDEIFGEKNFLFQITLLCNPKGRSQDKYIANCHEYLIGYSKQQLEKGTVNIPKNEDEIQKNYKLIDKRGRYRELELRNTHREFGKHNRKNLYYPFFVGKDGNVSLEDKQDTVAIYPDWEDGFEGCWTWGLAKSRLQIDEITAKKVKENWKIYRKNYAEDASGEATKQVKSIWTDKEFYTEKGQITFNKLFKTKNKIFQSPKSVDTIEQVLSMASNEDSIVMDFFAGSSTTAHAVMQLNAKDGGNRKFIMVQIDESINSDKQKDAYMFCQENELETNIAEISKERIRRAGQKTLEDNQDQQGIENLDIGFRVLKIDSTNMKDVYYTPDNYEQAELDNLESHIKEDRTGEDLLFQVMLDWGVPLSLPIEVKEIQGSFVYHVGIDSLVACFDTLTIDLIGEISKDKPLKFVSSELAIAHDQDKTNIKARFAQLSPNTQVKFI